MFFVISKITSYLLAPLFWIFVLALIAFLFRKRRAGKWILLGALILFYLFSNRFLLDEAVRAWEYPLTNQPQADSVYDAAIVLGGGVVNYDTKTDRLIFRENADKILQAVSLYRNGRAVHLMLSGGPGELFVPGQYEASHMKKYLISIGIPDSVILVDSVSRTTWENARNSAEILTKAMPGARCLLITTALHMPRAMGCFRKAGLDVTPFTTNKLTGSRRTDFEHLFIPQAECFLYWRNLIHEVVGYRVYKMKHYL
jgi:uncharacterized SAM-binding protein YcdF (DUF218 family)